MFVVYDPFARPHEANPSQWTQEQKLPPPQQQQRTGAQPQAPVANMMGNNTPTGRPSFSRPSSSHQPSLATMVPVAKVRTRRDSLDALAKYPYLHHAALERPAVYQSPYAPKGGFTDAWLPNPAAAKVHRMRSTSFSQEYYMKRSPTERESVKTHVRHISTDKALVHQQEAQQKQERLLWGLKQRAANSPIEMSPSAMSPPLMSPAVMSPPLMHTSGSSGRRTSGFQPHPFHQHDPDLQSPTFADFSSSYARPSHTYPTLLQEDHQSYHSNPGYRPQSFRYESPDEFQLQMHRDDQQLDPNHKEMVGYDAFLQQMMSIGHGHSEPHTHGTRNGSGRSTSDEINGSPLREGMRAAGRHESYDAFLQEMMNIGQGHSELHNHGTRDGSGRSTSDGISGSPLREGMRAAGGEMLPMMQDHY